MAKVRVYELAKELGLDNKEIMAKLRTLKIPVKSHMSVVPDEELDRVKSSLAGSEEVESAGGMEEKRVAKRVIRRRARPKAEEHEEETEESKVDLNALKQAAKKPRREEEEEAVPAKPDEEILDEIPKEWTEEEKPEKETKDKKAPAKKKKTAKKSDKAPVREKEVPEEEQPEKEAKKAKKAPAKAKEKKEKKEDTAAEATEAQAGPGPKKKIEKEKREPAPDPAPETEKAETTRTETAEPEEAQGPLEEVIGPEKPEKEAAGLEAAEEEKTPGPAPPVIRKVYNKPSIRRTARAPEGEPLPIPGQKPEAKPEEAAPASPEAEAEAKDTKKKKKKKKKKKGAEEADAPGLTDAATPRKKLRRKVAFKVQKGMEGMEMADVEQMYMPSKRKTTTKKKAAQKTRITTPKAQKRIIRMGENITVAELARHLGVKSKEIIKLLTQEGLRAHEDYPLDVDAAGLVASAYDYEIEQEIFDESKILGQEEAEREELLEPRAPVVTVMGHVDHGKTSLLDHIRKTRVTEGEAGAITQHIGASVVKTAGGTITFVDTPGHEAFTSMRARGAQVTDIVVLVVAADDGIMPQTKEAASHAQAAEVPIVVAINKIDVPNANIQAVKQRLSELGLTPEEWGGETQVVECSAKTGEGLPELMEAILLQAEVLELKADRKKAGKGLVIESRLDKGRGPVATVVVREGTLKQGTPVLCGTYYGKIRAMIDDRGKQAKEAGPSVPVEIMGISGVPEPGETLFSLEDEKKAKTVADHRSEQLRAQSEEATPGKVSLEELMEQLKEGEVQELKLILKTDTQGTAEAIKSSVEKLSNPEVKVAVIHQGVGNITENDVLLASASNAVILGFTVKTEGKAKTLADNEGVQIRTYDIIYNLIDDVKASVQGMLKPVYEEQVIGKAEVRKVFRITKVGAVAGSYVTEGKIKRNARARVIRDQDVVYNGKLSSLKRVTDDVREVNQGYECGIGLENFNDVQEGDVIEAYVMEESTPTLA